METHVVSETYMDLYDSKRPISSSQIALLSMEVRDNNRNVKNSYSYIIYISIYWIPIFRIGLLRPRVFQASENPLAAGQGTHAFAAYS